MHSKVSKMQILKPAGRDPGELSGDLVPPVTCHAALENRLAFQC